MFTEDELLKGCLKGNRVHQKALYELYAGKMYAVCLRYANDTMQAEDFLQDGFVKVFSNLDKYRNEGSFEGWIRRIIINCALQKLRSQKYELVKFEPEIHHTSDTSENILSVLAANELISLIQKLPNGYRTVFNLYVLEEYTHRDIAKELGITEGTSKSQLARARSMLQKMVSKNESFKDVSYAEARGNR